MAVTEQFWSLNIGFCNWERYYYPKEKSNIGVAERCWTLWRAAPEWPLENAITIAGCLLCVCVCIQSLLNNKFLIFQ